MTTIDSIINSMQHKICMPQKELIQSSWQELLQPPLADATCSSAYPCRWLILCHQFLRAACAELLQPPLQMWHVLVLIPSVYIAHQCCVNPLWKVVYVKELECIRK